MKINEYLGAMVISWIDHKSLQLNFSNFEIAMAVYDRLLRPVTPNTAWTDDQGDMIVGDADDIIYVIVGHKCSTRE
jgi:hypothetical protein